MEERVLWGWGELCVNLAGGMGCSWGLLAYLASCRASVCHVVLG